MLILWAPVAAFEKPLGLLLLAMLMVLGTEVLRRQAEAEFPDATFGGFGDRVRVWGRGRAEPSAPPQESKAEQIERSVSPRAPRERSRSWAGRYRFNVHLHDSQGGLVLKLVTGSVALRSAERCRA